METAIFMMACRASATDRAARSSSFFGVSSMSVLKYAARSGPSRPGARAAEAWRRRGYRVFVGVYFGSSSPCLWVAVADEVQPESMVCHQLLGDVFGARIPVSENSR